eukprot:TRINITY_DN90551_c0_g1_i1.p1 TRINITY_DN90551_c0_g1~~TRINITY_DN90551_c0_g1_i1.p1  ORF type:complete len:149 (-),score=22.83 TRINITY_DN90551_c0_g1_i1:102-548(-)
MDEILEALDTYLGWTMLGGIANAVEEWPKSKLYAMTCFAVMNVVMAMSQYLDGRNAWVLLLIIPSALIARIEALTMHLASKVCEMIGMPHKQEAVFLLASCAMMWLPWKIVRATQPHASEGEKVTETVTKSPAGKNGRAKSTENKKAK